MMTFNLSIRGVVTWAAIYFAVIAAIAVSQILEIVGLGLGLGLMMAASLLFVPMMVRASATQARWRGSTSPALDRYNRRFLLATLAYAAGLMLATWLRHHHAPSRAAAALLAMLPAVPTLAMVAAMARYLAEESDEYLRHRSIQGALAGLGLVLVLGSFWGFLETFGAAPHVWAWWVVPAWAVGMGLGQAWAGRRAR